MLTPTEQDQLMNAWDNLYDLLQRIKTIEDENNKRTMENYDSDLDDNVRVMATEVKAALYQIEHIAETYKP